MENTSKMIMVIEITKAVIVTITVSVLKEASPRPFDSLNFLTQIHGNGEYHADCSEDKCDHCRHFSHYFARLFPPMSQCAIKRKHRANTTKWNTCALVELLEEGCHIAPSLFDLCSSDD